MKKIIAVILTVVMISGCGVAKGMLPQKEEIPAETQDKTESNLPSPSPTAMPKPSPTPNTETGIVSKVDDRSTVIRIVTAIFSFMSLLLTSIMVKANKDSIFALDLNIVHLIDKRDSLSRCMRYLFLDFIG
jgi:hypothetical protein